MIITEKNRFLNLPIDPDAERQKLRFSEGGRLLCDLEVCLGFDNPKYYYPYDLIVFMGRDIEISEDGGRKFSFSEEKTPPPDEPLKPLVHFTADYGLINDPNGLIFYEGRYHMFFQHNPAGNIMAHMHWGHAVSEDLINWEQLPEAIMPDNMGDMWSGSSIVDKKNLLGFNTDEHEALVIFYTAAGGLREASESALFTQCMAISTDGGYTFKKYKDNPILPYIKNQNRDPKVVYHEESDAYVMVLYIDNGEFALFSSRDLINWAPMQTFVPGATTECPDLFELYDADRKKWVFAGGDSGYLVGDFDIEKGLINVGAKGRYAYGRIYAGQTFSNIKGRVLRVDIQKTRELPTEYFNSFMTLPYELYLKDNSIRLKLAPEVEKAEVPVLSDGFVSLDSREYDLPDYSAKIKLGLSSLEEKASICLFGTEIEIDAEAGEIRFEDVVMPMFSENGRAELMLIADRICFEIFSADRFVGGKGIVFVGKEKKVSFKGPGIIDSIEICRY